MNSREKKQTFLFISRFFRSAKRKQKFGFALA
jgi:hypothetical protein